MNDHRLVSDGTNIWAVGGGACFTSSFKKLTQKFDVWQIYCGMNHSLIFKTNGNLCGCGSNEDNKLNLGDEQEDCN